MCGVTCFTWRSISLFMKEAEAPFLRDEKPAPGTGHVRTGVKIHQNRADDPTVPGSNVRGGRRLAKKPDGAGRSEILFVPGIFGRPCRPQWVVAQYPGLSPGALPGWAFSPYRSSTSPPPLSQLSSVRGADWFPFSDIHFHRCRGCVTFEGRPAASY